MFNFDDNQKNPLMFMMNLMNKENTENGDAPEGASEEEELLELMKEAFGMQKQMMQTMQAMCMMPMQLMLAFLNGVAEDAPGDDAPKSAAPEGQKGGFKLGNMEIPPKLLARLMQMDMSPENLAKLQRVLDFVFDAMPQPKDE